MQNINKGIKKLKLAQKNKTKTKKLKKVIKKDKKLIKKLAGNRYGTMNDYRLSAQQYKVLSNQVAGYQTSYLKSLIFPETSMDAKIPSVYPLPTLSYKLKTTIQFTTNAAGNAAVLINPWYLPTDNFSSFILINNAGALDLNGAGTSNFTAYPMTPRVDSTNISAYRLVSASVTCFSVNPAISRSGVIRGGIVTRAGQVGSYLTLSGGGVSTNNPFGGNCAISTNIDQVMYCQTADVSAGEAFRAIYLPFDPTFEMFVEVNRSRAQALNQEQDDFYWNFYCRGAANQPFQLEINYNFELEPNMESFTATMVDTNFESPNNKDIAINNIIKHPSLIVQAETDVSQKIEREEENMNNQFFHTMYEKGKSFIEDNGELLSVLGNLAVSFL